jgi:VanZ family protein
MITLRRFINTFPWGRALLLWTLVIFYFSSRPGSPYPIELTTSYYLERKGAHVFEYAVLAILLMGFLRRYFGKNQFLGIALLAIALAGLYGVTDEIHQYFTPYRGARLSDVGIDILGAILGIGVVYTVRKLFLAQKK